MQGKRGSVRSDMISILSILGQTSLHPDPGFNLRYLKVQAPRSVGEKGLLARAAHSVCGLLVCGSEKHPDHRSCLLQTDPLEGNFTETAVELLEERTDHLCWDIGGPGGDILLLGGSRSGRTTELVQSDGSNSSASFNLTQHTE